MQRRQEEERHIKLIGEIEKMIGKDFTDAFKADFIKGAGELELVRSGLDDTMRAAYQSMRDVWRSRSDVESLRVAAFLVSIDRVAQAYAAKGL